MNSDFLFLCDVRVVMIMKCIKSPTRITQISKNTHLPIATIYRLVAQLEKNQYLKSFSERTSSGVKVKKYQRGIKYQIITTADGATLIIFDKEGEIDKKMTKSF